MAPHSLPDLQKTDAVYLEHQHLIEPLLADARQCQHDIQRVFDRGAAKVREGYSSPNGSSVVKAIDRKTHFYCELLQRVFHVTGIEVYADGGEPEHIRDILERALSIRLSMLNHPVEKKPTDYHTQIEDMHAISVQETGTSIVPYLYSPNSALRRVKTQLQDKKFSSMELLSQLSTLYRDQHVLHTMCITLAMNGMPEEGALLIDVEAKQSGMPTWQFLCQSPDLTGAYLLSLVESNQPDAAIVMAKKLLPVVKQNEKACEKYVTALRMKGRFDEAIAFLRDVQKTGMDSKNLAQQFSMAIKKNPAMLLQK